MSNADVVWPIEPHTVAKHDILRGYLEAWFPIMAGYVQKSNGNRLVYVDGFAGPGEYSRGEKGSPVIALETLLTHKRWSQQLAHLQYTFLFIEADQKRANHLQGMLNGVVKPPNVGCHVQCGEFEKVLTGLLDPLESKGASLAPAFVFIDPFGPTGFGMALVQRLLGYRGCELLITLNLRDLNRWWLPEESKHDEVNRLFGTTDWRDCLKQVD
ncbi:MAG: three-Cys-motif partner protein TcmP, partial [Chloroflexota bacterium]|nr:three-Cys-motif partner protein TcmP [Chloroflexota bacterium]